MGFKYSTLNRLLPTLSPSLIRERKPAFTLAEGDTHIAKPNKQRKIAFTLAEVLITLGIIGVVAAMTMPSLIASYEKQKTVTQVKKIYSAMSQSVQMAQADYGDIDSWDWSLDAFDFFDLYLAKNFNIIKNCKSATGCWNDNGVFQLRGSLHQENPLNSYWSKLTLSDGTYVALLKQDNAHIHIMVDINGSKKPDRFGKDIFEFTMTSEPFTDYAHKIAGPGLYFFCNGLSRDELAYTNSEACNSSKTGQCCGALIMYDGWQIKNDYPW